jgi:hypothetical protein
MADLAQIAQSGVDPISGSYLSAERRKAIFAKSRNVSSNIFRRGGPLVAINRQPDEGALALVQTQSQTITALQEQVNSLRTQVVNLNNVVSIQTQTIGGLQEQVGGLKTEVTDFSGALSRITDVIAYDSVLEQNRTRQEQEEQRRATEQGLRVGRESLLEKAIQGALVAPVQKIAQKAQSILSKVAQFFTTLFAGWFANKGIEVLRALSEGNGKKLEEIRDNVLKGLGIAAGTLFLLNGGFFAIAGTITKLSLKIGGWLLKNTVGRFFGALGNLLKSAGNAIVSTAKAGVAAITGSGVKAATAGSGAKAATAGSGAKAATTGSGAKAATTGSGAKAPRMKGMGGPLNLLLGGFDFFQRKGEGQTNLQAGAGAVSTVAGSAGGFSAGAAGGAWLGAFGGPLAPFTVPAGALIGGITASIAGAYGAGKLSDMATGVGKNKPAVTPKTPVVPKNKAPNAPTPVGNEQSFDQKMGDLTSQASKIDWRQPAQYGEGNINPEQGTPAQVSSQPAQADIKTPAQTSKIATLPLNVGPAPEPTPNVVYKRIGSPAQQQSGAAPTGGSVNEVPAISASNPDNFYVLYSQVNYNVVT